MKLYINYSLVFALATAPMLAHNNDMQPHDDSNQPKSFWDRCYEQRSAIIGITIGTLCAAAILACIFRSAKTTSFSIEITPGGVPQSPTLPESPQGSATFAYPKGYSELSKKYVDDLRKKINPIFDKICNGSCDDISTLSCDQAVNALEEMYRTGKKRGFLIASIAERRLNNSILDPLERSTALELIEQAADKLCPVPAKQTVEILNPVPAQSSSDYWWDYFYGFLAGG